MSDVIAIVSAIVAVVSAVVSGLYALKSNKLAELAVRDSYLERVRDWADTTIEVTVAIVRLCRTGSPQDGFEGRRDDLRTLLSAQIEKGRWFSPNILDEHVEEKKEAAYCGHRQKILDCLVKIYDDTDGLVWDQRQACRETLFHVQKTFVSEVQARLDPTRRDIEYRLHLDRYAERGDLVEGWSTTSIAADPVPPGVS